MPITLQELTEASPEMAAEWKSYWQSKNQEALDPIDFLSLQSALSDTEWPRMWVSPNGSDIRHLRPYFLVPLLETAFVGEQTVVRKEIVRHVHALVKDGRQPTDVIIVSHGWHRNYFAAVSVYDRLLSRFGALSARRRIDLEDRQPLLIALHWHSDPGANGWEDMAGRRHRESYLTNARSTFEPCPGVPESEFLTDFEEMFVQMARLSAPGVATRFRFPSTPLEQLTAQLKKYQIRDVPNSQLPMTSQQYLAGPDHRLDQKVASLWRCYVEAESKSLLLDQTERPRPFAGGVDAIRAIVKFAVGILGVSAVVLALLGNATVKKVLWSTWIGFRGWFHGFGSPIAQDIAAALSIPIAGFVILSCCHFWRAIADRSRPGAAPSVGARGIPILQVAAWLPLQIACILPVLLFLVTSWIFRTPYVLLAPAALWIGLQYGAQSEPLSWAVVIGTTILFLLGVTKYGRRLISPLFSERLRDSGDRAFNLRDKLATLARVPINLVRQTVALDSGLRPVLSGMENQLAFFEYQRKGVEAGRDAGYFIRDLVNDCPELQGVPIQFIGHSFGSLVVTNAVRELLDPPSNPVSKLSFFRNRRRNAGIKIRKLHRRIFEEADPGKRETNQPTPGGDHAARLQYAKKLEDARKIKVHSLSLIQGAIASNWFAQESAILEKMCGPVACIYSKYDTANGFYYPFANNGRLAAGYVGLSEVNVSTRGEGGEFSMLNLPPDSVKNFTGRYLNLDGSRLIYEGAIVSGGGHDDIFKDDVLHLLCAVTQTQDRC